MGKSLSQSRKRAIMTGYEQAIDTCGGVAEG